MGSLWKAIYTKIFIASTQLPSNCIHISMNTPLVLNDKTKQSLTTEKNQFDATSVSCAWHETIANPLRSRQSFTLFLPDAENRIQIAWSFFPMSYFFFVFLVSCFTFHALSSMNHLITYSRVDVDGEWSSYNNRLLHNMVWPTRRINPTMQFTPDEMTSKFFLRCLHWVVLVTVAVPQTKETEIESRRSYRE